MKRGYRAHGKGRIKRTDAARNAKLPDLSTRSLAHRRINGKVTLRLDQVDKRGSAFRAIQAGKAEVIAHLGGEALMTPTKAELASQFAVLRQFAAACAARVLQHGMFNKAGQLSPAALGYRLFSKDLRELTRELGLDRHQKPVPTLGEILAGHVDPDQEPES